MESQASPHIPHCPVCDSEEASLRYRVDSAEASQHFILREANAAEFARLQQEIEDLWKTSVCGVFQCSQCSFIYASPFVAGSLQFYTLAYKRESYPEWKWEFELTRSTLEQLIGRDETKSVKLLEIGAGDGAFLRSVSPRLVAKENILSTEYSEYGLNKIGRYGIDCRALDPRNIDSSYHGYFDVICMFHILEHLDDLHSLFAKLRALVKPGGNLFIAVPNDGRIEFNEKNGALLDMPPNHIGRWNRKCFELVCSRHGWRVIDHRRESGKLLEVLKEYSVYRYRRQSQSSRRLASRVETIVSRPLRRSLQIPLVGFEVLRAFPLVWGSPLERLGNSQWVWAAAQ
jgi:SAM-dependent methyltransferase